MKRILVIDESEVIRETLALILGREFTVVKRPPRSSDLSVAEGHDEVDLLILGVAPKWTTQTASLLRFAAQAPFAVLFLVDSRNVAQALFAKNEQIACITKPFNPYELQEKVGRLLAGGGAWTAESEIPAHAADRYFSRYLEYPFVTRSVAAVARRFATSRLPILIFGERGCGQGQLARALCHAYGDAGPRFTIDAPSVTASELESQGAEWVAASNQKSLGITLVINRLDKADPDAQSLLAKFLEQKGEKFANIRLFATANADLLELVYGGEFLEDLYYKLATLTLKLAPLRDRREDLGALAEWFARSYAAHLGLGECFISQGAKNRLTDYLWFGNLNEMETVIARTLALHRKSSIEAVDLVFDFSGVEQIPVEPPGDFAEFIPGVQAATAAETPSADVARDRGSTSKSNGYGKLPEINVVIHELAHEFKNPMVTIKTFAQLLGDRYDDENFRARFQEVVGADIERMDDLLEVMVEFADFASPRVAAVGLEEKLRSVIDEVGGECAKRQTRLTWTGNARAREIRADDAQLTYILKNVFLTVLAQSKVGSEIAIELAESGSVAVSYTREGARVASIMHYLTDPSGESKESLLPLRLLLAKQLVERNGGRLAIDTSDNDRETVRMEFAIGQHGKEN